MVNLLHFEAYNEIQTLTSFFAVLLSQYFFGTPKEKDKTIHLSHLLFVNHWVKISYDLLNIIVLNK